MLIRKKADIPSSEITPESIYLDRRKFMHAAIVSSAAAGLGCSKQADATDSDAGLTYLPANENSQAGFYTKEKLTPKADISQYANFYEFGTRKSDPAQYAYSMKTSPWQVEVAGEVENPGSFFLEDILSTMTLEERVYRLRCVEAWSMVVPWIGFSLVDLLQRFKPTSKAKYVAFTTLHEPKQMRGQRSFTSGINWPYVEGLRIDEAVHPLTILAVGLYGKVLPNENGAPLRLVVPWKYGFKSIKSIVKIELLAHQPPTTWNQLAPREYGFFANVNPDVDHPRWSQRSERRLPSALLNPNRVDTLAFNGYGEQVSSLYTGMNLRKYY